MVTITINYGGFPKGTEVAIKDLGSFPNSTPVVLSEERVAAFENKVGVDIADFFATSPQISIESKSTLINKKTEEVTK
jgi:hypothetical protein